MKDDKRFDDSQDIIHPDVIVIGDVLMDYQYWIEEMPNPGEDVTILSQEKNSGGSAANTAIALSSEGISCGFCGRIGTDEVGREITELMKNIGLDLTYMQYGGTTGYTITMIEKSGERTMFSYRDTAGFEMTLTSRLRQALCNAKLLFLSGYMLTEPSQAEYAIEAAKQIKLAGGIVMLDASPKIGSVDKSILDRILALTDVLSPNKDELAALTETTDVKKGLNMLSKRLPCVILKLGSEGSTLVVNSGFSFAGGDMNSERIELHVSAKPVVPIDTTGAGDAFNAGFITSYIKGEPPAFWAESGNALAARVISTRGAASAFTREKNRKTIGCK